jgi:ABC-2 type transport system ATP-binding protein
MSVPAGTVQGLLGPNGAGKTTLVRILATLLAPGTGRARISGVDVQQDPNTVRSLIGLAGQYAAVDETLTGRENLVMVGRLYRLRGQAGQGPGRRVAGAAGAGGGSGPPGEDLFGRHAPPPGPGCQPGRAAPGADPGRADHPGSIPAPGWTCGRSSAIWWPRAQPYCSPPVPGRSRPARAHHSIVIDRGQVIASGTSAELKARLGGDLIAVEMRAADLDRATTALAGTGCGAPVIDRARAQVTIPVCDPVPDLMAALRTLDATRAPRSKTVRSPGPPEFRPGRMIWPSICGVVPVPARTDRSAPRNRSRAANPPSITTDRECWSCPRLGPGGPLCRTGPDHRRRSVRTSPRSRRLSVEGDDQSDHRQGARGDERLGPAPRCGLCRGVDPRDGG